MANVFNDGNDRLRGLPEVGEDEGLGYGLGAPDKPPAPPLAAKHVKGALAAIKPQPRRSERNLNTRRR